MCASATLYGLVTISWPWYNDRNKVLFFWLLCSILKQEFTLVSVKVLGIYFHFGEYLLIIAYMFSIVCQCTYECRFCRAFNNKPLAREARRPLSCFRH